MNKYQKALNTIEGSYVYHQSKGFKEELSLLQELINKYFEVRVDEVTVHINTLIDLAKGNIGTEEITGMSIEELEGL